MQVQSQHTGVGVAASLSMSGKAKVEATVPEFISVIIPHYNDLENLALCVSKLEAQSLDRARYEIVVADNNSRCGVDAVASAVPTARVVSALEQGAGPARNKAISVARGDIYALIDSDCVPDRAWLEAGIAALADADYVGGHVITTTVNPDSPTPAAAYEVVFAFNFEKYIKERGFTGTGNMFIPKRVFDVVGPFRDQVAEDVDWCHRANAMSFRIGYATGAIVSHPARESWSDLKLKHCRVTREGFALYNEKKFGRLLWTLRSGLVAVSPLVHAHRVILSKRLPNVRAKLSGLRGLCAIRGFRAYQMLGLVLQGRP